jgi:hypothetical protein
LFEQRLILMEQDVDDDMRSKALGSYIEAILAGAGEFQVYHALLLRPCYSHEMIYWQSNVL